MKRLILLLALAATAFGQTTVSDTIRTSTGALANGTFYVTPSQRFTTSGGIPVYPIAIPVAVRNGLFTVRLFPNDATSDPTSAGCPTTCTTYSVRYALTNQAIQNTETWLVPTSGSPVTLATVRHNPVPGPFSTLLPSQISSVGGAIGDCIVLNASLIPVWGTVCPKVPYTTTVTAQTSVSISAATHGMGLYAIPKCFTSATPRVEAACNATRDTSGNLAFVFAPAFTGLIQVGPN